MKEKIFIITLILFCVLCFTRPVFSFGVQREAINIDQGFGIGARAMGMGGAHIAASEDVSAIYWNPAGLAMIRRIELSGTITHESTDNDSRFFGTPTNSSISNTNLNSIGLAYPIPTLRGSLVLGVAVNRVHSFNMSYLHKGYNPIRVGDDFEGYGDRQETEKQFAEGGLYVWGFSGAMDVSKNLSLGISLNLWDGNYDGVWQLTEEDVEQHWPMQWDIIDTKQTDEIDMDALNIVFGGIYRVTRDLNLGFSIASQTNIEINGERLEEYRVYDFGEPIPEPDYYNIEYLDTEIPWHFGVGLAYSQKIFMLSADFQFVPWSEIDQNREDPGLRKMYDDVWKFRIGGEVLVPGAPVRARVGFYTDPIPYQGTEVTKNRNFLTAGLGILIDRVFTVDAAIVNGKWELADNQYQYNLETTSNRLFLTGTYHF